MHYDEQIQQPLNRKSSNSLSCNICLQTYNILAKWPIEACENGHYFCDQCIENLFACSKNQPVPCPICRRLILSNKFSPKRDIFKRINKQFDKDQIKNEKQKQLIEFAMEHEIYQIVYYFKNKKIDQLRQLEHLECSSRQIKQINHLQYFERLTFLQLQSNQINRIDGLSKLKFLSILNLNNNQITEINHITSPYLEVLAMVSNKVRFLQLKCSINKIKYLFLYNNPLDQESYKCIANDFPSLSFLSIDSKQQVRQHQKNKNSFKLTEIIAKENFQELSSINLQKYGQTVDEFIRNYYKFGETANFSIDSGNPFHVDYVWDQSHHKLTKSNDKFTMINCQNAISESNKANLKLLINKDSTNIILGICKNQYKHNINLYSMHFAGLTFWGIIYYKGQSRTTQLKLSVADNTVVRMCVDFKKVNIGWFFNEIEVDSIPLPLQFLETELYFVLGMRDAGTNVTFLSDLQ